MTRSRSLFPPRLAPAACAALFLVCAACAGGGRKEGPPPPRKFAVPLFDGLWLGMTRDEAARAHPIRPALTSAGQSRLGWGYDRSGEEAGGPTVKGKRPGGEVQRAERCLRGN